MADSDTNSWQPMETAPKDGTEILGFLLVANKSRAILWRKDWNQWQTVPGYATARPTHWQPLPAPPSGIDQ